MKAKPFLLLILILLGLIFSFWLFYKQDILVINNIKIKVELADTQEKQIQGLSGRKILNENSGMFFIYDKSAVCSVWMKDMHFPIDVIWIDQNWQIVDITKNIQPSSFPAKFESPPSCQYFLETNADFADKTNIQKDDKIELKKARLFFL